ncbi:MAG: agmatinase [Bacteroidales bacterium]|jgi:agmatinase|nr:agmatinase [Bacteroidales bacterium]
MRTFGKIEDEYAGFKESEILLQSFPYDGTSTWGKGSHKAFEAFLEASDHLELYDIETDSEVFRKGIHIMPEISLDGDPGEVTEKIYRRTAELLENDKLLTFIGGEHSVSIGIIKAFAERYADLTVLQLDAHTDLRPEYMDSPFNHACAMHEASKLTDLVQVGIRSMDSAELPYFDRSRCIFASEMQGDDSWIDRAAALLGNNVYISIDMDVFDPSLVPATGTPEPGGITWYQALKLLRKVCAVSNVRGFDLVELSPLEKIKAPAFMMVKLFYKILSYKYYG